MAHVRLTDLDSKDAAALVVGEVLQRMTRDADRLGITIRQANAGEDESQARAAAVFNSVLFRATRALADWAKFGRGNPAEMAVLHQEVGADFARGMPGRAPDPTTIAGVILVGAGARLALLERRTVSAIEIAILAGLHEHSVRAVAKTGALPPLGSGRPMRFAAEHARAFLYIRGGPGFGALATG